jgi:uncharacterized heparinase superfamily protein
MHESLDALTLSSGEPVYFNGCGHLPHDVLDRHAVQRFGPAAARALHAPGRLWHISAMATPWWSPIAGCCRSLASPATAHASALAFEFSHGTELILGSCGPAPADLPESKRAVPPGHCPFGPDH